MIYTPEQLKAAITDSMEQRSNQIIGDMFQKMIMDSTKFGSIFHIENKELLKMTKNKLEDAGWKCLPSNVKNSISIEPEE